MNFRIAASQAHAVITDAGGDWLTAGAIREATGVDMQTTTRALRLLKDEGHVEHNGLHYRGSAYRVGSDNA